MGNDKSGKTNLRDAILRYFQINPNAADSLAGIMNWWLPMRDEQMDAASIEQTLEQLTAEGLVKKILLIDGTILYRHG